MKNEELYKEVVPTDSELKNIIVQYVGNSLNPEDDSVTIENVIDIFAKEFPEVLLAVAEENWINGYTKALNDLHFVEKEKIKYGHDRIPEKEKAE